MSASLAPRLVLVLAFSGAAAAASYVHYTQFEDRKVCLQAPCPTDDCLPSLAARFLFCEGLCAAVRQNMRKAVHLDVQRERERALRAGRSTEAAADVDRQ